MNATAGALLGFLCEGPMTGWQVAQTAEVALCDFWNLERSQVYRELAKLAEDGFIEAGEKGVREQVPYSVTERGRAAFLEWLREDPGPETMRSPIHLKLSFAQHLDEETCARFVRLHRARNEERLAYYRKLEASIKDARPYHMHVLRFGIAFRTALISWLDSLPWSGGGPPKPKRAPRRRRA